MPSNAEWEKAARGDADARAWPCGDTFEETRCNTHELGLDQTSPVGIFGAGASPYGCLDMAGNVWEWTRSLWGTDWQPPQFGYPYSPDDAAREDLGAGDEMLRLVRGGSWIGSRDDARCAFRFGYLPVSRDYVLGFRVVLRSSPVLSPGTAQTQRSETLLRTAL